MGAGAPLGGGGVCGAAEVTVAKARRTEWTRRVSGATTKVVRREEPHPENEFFVRSGMSRRSIAATRTSRVPGRASRRLSISGRVRTAGGEDSVPRRMRRAETSGAKVAEDGKRFARKERAAEGEATVGLGGVAPKPTKRSCPGGGDDCGVSEERRRATGSTAEVELGEDGCGAGAVEGNHRRAGEARAEKV